MPNNVIHSMFISNHYYEIANIISIDLLKGESPFLHEIEYINYNHHHKNSYGRWAKTPNTLIILYRNVETNKIGMILQVIISE